MAGIVSYGSYIPYRRLKRAAIAEVLGVPAAKGERSVASFDEDSVSMAVEATRDALRRDAHRRDRQRRRTAAGREPRGRSDRLGTRGALGVAAGGRRGSRRRP